MTNYTRLKEVLTDAKHSINALSLYLDAFPPLGLPCFPTLMENIVYLQGYLDCMSQHQIPILGIE